MGSLGIEIRGDKRGEGCIFVLTMLWAAHQFVFDDVEIGVSPPVCFWLLMRSSGEGCPLPVVAQLMVLASYFLVSSLAVQLRPSGVRQVRTRVRLPSAKVRLGVRRRPPPSGSDPSESVSSPARVLRSPAQVRQSPSQVRIES